MILKESTEKYYNPILEKSFKFAVRIIRFYKLESSTDYHLNSLFKQLLRSGTSIGQMFLKHKVHSLKKIL